MTSPSIIHSRGKQILHALLLAPGKDRYWEIDAVRGCAIIMMVIFHTVFDLAYFNLFPVTVSSGPFRMLAVATASLFLVVAGLSAYLSLCRSANPLHRKNAWKRTTIRGATIFGYGLCVTAATAIYPGEGIIVFGILHLIGCCVILSPLFLRLGRGTIVAGIVLILLSIVTAGIYGPPWLIPLGIHPESFWSLDYTPFIPWAGLFLAGMYVGFMIYPGGNRRYSVPTPTPPLQWLSIPGRHSLAIYLVHQPVILALLFLLFPHG